MSEDRPIIIKAEHLEVLNDKEMVEGYQDGFAGEPEPGNNRSDSYWHGWRNGNSDRTGKSYEGQAALAHDIIETGYLRRPNDQ